MQERKPYFHEPTLVALSVTSINQQGNVGGFGLHDATLIGLEYQESNLLAITVRRVDLSVATILLRGVGPFGFVGFRSGAIVSALFVWEPSSASITAASIPRTAWSVLFGNDIPLGDLTNAVGPIVRAARFNHLVFFECSYGGSMAALCREIEVEVDC
jgi:hypothetical protein